MVVPPIFVAQHWVNFNADGKGILFGNKLHIAPAPAAGSTHTDGDFPISAMPFVTSIKAWASIDGVKY